MNILKNNRTTVKIKISVLVPSYQSTEFIQKFFSTVYSCTGFDKFLDSCIHCHSCLQNSPSTGKSHSAPECSTCPLTPGNHRSLFSSSRFALPLWDCEVIHMEDMFSLWESSKLFSKVAVPPCVTSNRVRHYLFPKYKITFLQNIFHGTGATSHW